MILWKDTCHFLPKFALSFVIFFQNAHDVSAQIIKNAHFIAKIRFLPMKSLTTAFYQIDTWI